MAQLELVHRLAPPDAHRDPRPDEVIISKLVDDGARVLDVGCGDGTLLQLLARTCGTRGSGLERDVAQVRDCVARGLSVAQGDADSDLVDFPSANYDYVIFSHALQALADPRAALRNAGRIGARVIVTTRNAAHWRSRVRLGLGGRAWSEAAHPCSVRDMAELAGSARLSIETAVPLSRGRPGAPFAKTLWRANWFAEEAVFLFSP